LSVVDDRGREVARRLRGEEPSEFGRGFIQQLFYFMEHITRDEIVRVNALAKYQKGDCSKEELLRNYPDLVIELRMSEHPAEVKIFRIMNAASDHLFDLVIPEKVPEDIRASAEELRSLALDMGHGDGLTDRTVCTLEKFDRVRNLVLELGRMLDMLVFDIVVDGGEYK
jgi:hypothetical protein